MAMEETPTGLSPNHGSADGAAAPLGEGPGAAAYQRLEARFARMSHLSDAMALMNWDMQVLMPDAAAPARGAAMAGLAGLAHELVSAPETAEDVATAEADAEVTADPWRAANLREMARAHAHAAAAPTRLIEAAEAAAAAGEMAWRRAREEDDFAQLRPHLETLVSLHREIGEAVGDALGLSVYDALLDGYEPGLRAERIDALFAELAAFLPDFTGAVIERQAAEPEPAPLSGPFPQAAQTRVLEAMMARFGFAFERGRLDASLHPFCCGFGDEVRVTTRYDEADFSSALLAALHETGHAVYDQNLPRRWRAQPVGEARGMALHESQSLLVEMQIARGPAFLRFAAQELRRAFDRSDDDPAFQAENLERLFTRVSRGFIRVEADEVTYPAHVMLRYRLERAMLAGDLAIADLPGAWRDGMEELVGVRPETDREGCLQDIHWPNGAWGYFPTYTLGAMAAAQLFEAARKDAPDLEDRLAAGDPSSAIDWMRARVHARASSASLDQILADATGAELGVGAFKRHLEARYGVA